MKIEKTSIPDVKLIEPRVFEDNRGYFYEAFRESVLREGGIEVRFVQDNVSKSVRNTLRGLHYQIVNPQAKLVQCLHGKIMDVAVDIRRGSPTFGHYVAAELSSQNKQLLFIPEGFAHGFLVLSDEAVVSYKCSDYYNAAGERGIKWNDPEIGINWNIEHPVLSEKDAQLPLLSELKNEDLFA